MKGKRMKEVKNRDKWLLMFVVVVAVFLGLSLCQGCGTVAGMGNDVADICNGYSIQAGRRAAAQTRWTHSPSYSQINLQPPVVSD